MIKVYAYWNNYLDNRVQKDLFQLIKYNNKFYWELIDYKELPYIRTLNRRFYKPSPASYKLINGSLKLIFSFFEEDLQ